MGDHLEIPRVLGSFFFSPEQGSWRVPQGTCDAFLTSSDGIWLRRQPNRAYAFSSSLSPSSAWRPVRIPVDCRAKLSPLQYSRQWTPYSAFFLFVWLYIPVWKTPRSSATDLGAFSNPRSFFLHTFALRIMTYFGSQHFRNEQDTRFLISLNLTGTSEDSCSKSGSFLHWSLVRSTKLTVLDRHKQTCPPWISVRVTWPHLHGYHSIQ